MHIAQLAELAREKAALPFHGYLEGQEPNIWPILHYFPRWDVREADKLWCAAFVYYCCREAGYDIPLRPRECTECNLAGCGSWEEYALGDNELLYFRDDGTLRPQPGDIVLYDHVFMNREHDHIGIVLEVEETSILAAEGNYGNTNLSGCIRRKRDAHIRAFIRLPETFWKGKRREDTVFFETERLVVRNLQPKDAEEMADYRNHPACARYQRGQTRDTEGIRRLIQRRGQDTLSTEEPAMLAVALKDSDTMVGEIVVRPEKDAFVFGYTFSYKIHRQGYAFEALSALLGLLRSRYPTISFRGYTEEGTCY